MSSAAVVIGALSFKSIKVRQIILSISLNMCSGCSGGTVLSGTHNICFG